MTWNDSIPWLVAIVGWGFTHIFSEARERRKEVRAQIDKVYEQLYKLEESARVFHCEAQFDAAKAGDLMAKIAILEKTLKRIPILEMDNLADEIIAFRRAITLKNFDKSKFLRQGQDSDILSDIYQANADLEDKIELQYLARYKSSFPFFAWGALFRR